MSFWKNNEAVPHWIYTCLPKTPGYLRTYPAKPSACVYPIRRASSKDTLDIAAFWSAHYKGTDWYMDARSDWVGVYLQDPSVIVLIAQEKSVIVATIVSTPLNGTVYMSHGATLRNTVRVIEGLVVHANYRNKGIAGHMIQAMDALTSRTSPVCHLWLREIPYEPLLTTAIQTSTYAYIVCKDAPPLHTTACAERASWLDFQHFWTRHTASVLRTRGDKSFLVLDTVNHRRRDMTVWKVVFNEIVHILVVSNTRRKHTLTGASIYELVWCGASQKTHMKQALEVVAAQLAAGVLFVSCADETWTAPWHYGTSGAHAWYMYNYMPPAFGSVEIHMIREEL
jgi:GNAT superfamily N-acetyltransferase